MTPTRCGVRGCVHRLCAFCLDWPWRCPEHARDHDLAERLHRLDLERDARRRSLTPTKGIAR